MWKVNLNPFSKSKTPGCWFCENSSFSWNVLIACSLKLFVFLEKWGKSEVFLVPWFTYRIQIRYSILHHLWVYFVCCCKTSKEYTRMCTDLQWKWNDNTQIEMNNILRASINSRKGGGLPLPYHHPTGLHMMSFYTIVPPGIWAQGATGVSKLVCDMKYMRVRETKVQCDIALHGFLKISIDQEGYMLYLILATSGERFLIDLWIRAIVCRYCSPVMWGAGTW